MTRVYKYTIQAVRLRRAPAVGHEWAQIQLCIKIDLQLTNCNYKDVDVLQAAGYVA